MSGELLYFLSLYEPRGERNGKALSGADLVCVVANPSTPTKQSDGVAFFVLYTLARDWAPQSFFVLCL